MKRAWWLMAFLLAGTACRNSGEGDYVRLAGNVFIFNYRIAEASYVVSLQRLRELPKGTELVATFENPLDGSSLVTRRPVFPGSSNIAVESDPVDCIAKGKPYSFRIELLHENKSLQILEGKIKSTLSSDVLPERPLVIGPGYERNPALTENSGKIQEALKNSKCKD
jgi:hypothetical protein